eukprot:1518466-Prymnesium_polylepis.1
MEVGHDHGHETAVLLAVAHQNLTDRHLRRRAAVAKLRLGGGVRLLPLLARLRGGVGARHGGHDRLPEVELL